LTLLLVALDGGRVAYLRVVGVAPGVAERPPLAQQVPAAVELDLDRLKAVAIGVQRPP
jgi:hypothetical protein